MDHHLRIAEFKIIRGSLTTFATAIQHGQYVNWPCCDLSTFNIKQDNVDAPQAQTPLVILFHMAEDQSISATRRKLNLREKKHCQQIKWLHLLAGQITLLSGVKATLAVLDTLDRRKALPSKIPIPIGLILENI